MITKTWGYTRYEDMLDDLLDYQEIEQEIYEAIANTGRVLGYKVG